jgi:hypothetical protein
VESRLVGREIVEVDQRAFREPALVGVDPPWLARLVQSAFEERPEVPGPDEVPDEWRGRPVAHSEAYLELDQAVIFLVQGGTLFSGERDSARDVGGRPVPLEESPSAL